MSGLGWTPPIVIYGAARSGTTYLVQLVNKHPEVHVSDETRIFAWAHDVYRRLPADDRTVYRKRDEFVDYQRRALPKYIRGFYRELAPEARYWGDKNPHYAHPDNLGCLETILELFPRARFINILRDGRDVVTSGLRGVWTDFDSVHRMWTSHLDIGCSFGRALPAEQYFELRYEELIQDDLAMARRMFEFLGIELHPDVERFCRNQQERRTPFCTPSRDIRSDVTRSDWADYLTPAQQVRSLELLGEHLVRFGYESRGSLDRALGRARAQQSEPAAAPAVTEPVGAGAGGPAE